MGWAQGVHARVRVSSRWLLPAAGAALGVILSAQAAHATVDTITYTGPVSPTTGAALGWSIAAPSGDTLSCSVLVDGTPTASGDCTTGTFTTPATVAGSYVLRATDTSDASPPQDSDPVVVVPPAPQLTGASTSNDPAPTVGVTDADPAATFTCDVSPSSDASVTSCGASTTLNITGSEGDYLLTVTAHAGGQDSAPATFTYTLDTTAPGQPTVTAPTSPDNDRTPTFTITTGAASVTCTATGPNGSVPLTTPCTTSAATLDLAGQSDGDYTLTVVAHDSAGNASTPATADYTLDATGPTAPTVTPGSAAGAGRSPSFTVTEPDAGTTLSCTVTGPDPSAAVATCGPTTTLNLTGVSDGTYTLHVTAKDALGNATTTTANYTLDTTAPTAPAVTGPTSGPHKSRAPSFTVTEPDAGTTLTCAVTSGPSPASVTICGASTVLDLTGALDGTYRLEVTATDAYGNAVITTVDYTLDATAPAAPTVSAPPALTNSKTVALTISDTEGTATLTCVLTGPGGGTVSSGACSGSVPFDTTGHADGTYTLVVTATDTAGNTSTTTVTWVRDTTPPPAPTVSAPPAFTRQPAVTLTISDGEAGVALTCALSGPGGTVSSGACPGDGAFDMSGRPDGTYTLVVTATDAADNTSTTTVSWVRDTAAPVKPVVAAPSSPARNRAPSFTVTEPEWPVTWTCTVSGPSTVVVTQCGLTVVVDLNGAADGLYTLSVTATDPAGNDSLAGTAAYTLDTTPPPAPDVSAPPVLTKAMSVTVTISDVQSDAVLTCLVTSPGGQTVFSGLCPADGTFDTAGFADGVYTLQVTATDSAGNASTTTVTWRRDTQPPPVPVVTTPASPGNTPAPSFAVTEPESPVTYTCSVDGPSTVTVTSCGLTVVLDLSNARDGIYTVFVTATDPAGNESAVGSASWELDTVAPPAPVVTAPQSPGNSRHPSFGVTDAEAGVHWSCSVAGPSVVAISQCGPATVLDLGGGADGLYTLTASALDAAGNVSTSSSSSFLLDTTPPPAPSVTVPATPSHDLTPAFGVSEAETGVQLTCVFTGPRGVVFSSPCPAGGGFDVTGFGDGLYTLAVTATDAAGNTATTTVTWTLDTVPPPAPGIFAPASPAQSRSVSFSVTDAESGVVYTCVLSGPSTGTVTSCGATATVDLAGAADGTYTLTVTATDAADNTSTSSSASYTLDTTAPTAPSITATSSPAQGKHPTFTIGGVEANGVLACGLSGPAGSTATVPSACGTGVGVDLSGQPDGTYTLTVTVTDAAGNVSRAGTASYTLDTTAPLAPTVGTFPTLGHDRSPSFGLSTEPGAVLTCTVARNFLLVASGPCGPGGSVDLSGYEDGEFEITVVATDAAGNVGPPVTVVYTLDTTPPAAADVTPPASPSPIVKPIWVFTIEDETTATCTVIGPTGDIVQGPVACSSPFTGLFKLLPDGTYTLTVVVTDAAGNDSAPVTSVFILDRHAPVPPTVLPPTSPDNSHHPAWMISGPKGATLTCTLLSGGQVVDGPGACPADGVYSLTGLPDGVYTLRVTATDSAGNVSATSVTTYVLDTVRPAQPDLDYSSPDSAGVHPFWGFSLPPGTIGRCQLWRDGVLLASKNNCKGAVSFDLTGRPAGTYTVRVYAVDAAGNLSHPLVASYVLGTRVSGPSSGPPSSTPGGVVPSGSIGGAGGGQRADGPALGRREVQQVLQHFTNATAPVRTAVKKAAHAVDQVASSIIPVIHDKVTEHVSKAVQGVVNAVSHAGGGTGFPLLLLFVVLAFLLMQNRIDRRDPKLALASVAADDTVEFLPPPSRPASRTKGKKAGR